MTNGGLLCHTYAHARDDKKHIHTILNTKKDKSAAHRNQTYLGALPQR